MQVLPVRLEENVYPCFTIQVYTDRCKHYFAECWRYDGSCFWTQTYTEVSEVLAEAARRREEI